jgi:hypothetical protein
MNMHTLQEFVLTNVVPAIEEVRNAQAHNDLAMRRAAHANVFESFLWLHLGTEIGVFPAEPSREVFSTYYADFFKSLNREQDRLLDVVAFRSRLYVYDTPESTELKSAFPDFTKLIEQSMRGNDVFNVQRNEFRDPDSLRPIFNNFLRMASVFASDPLILRFVLICQFSDARAWDNEWHGGDCVSEEVALAGETGEYEGSSSAIICAGFLRLWSYSHQLREMSNMYEKESIESVDRFKLIDRIKNNLRWRINLRSREVANRFESVRREIKKRLHGEAAESGNLRTSVDFIVNSMDTAFEVWLRHAVAGA